MPRVLIPVTTVYINIQKFRRDNISDFFCPNINPSEILSCPKLFPVEIFRKQYFPFFAVIFIEINLGNRNFYFMDGQRGNDLDFQKLFLRFIFVSVRNFLQSLGFLSQKFDEISLKNTSRCQICHNLLS